MKALLLFALTVALMSSISCGQARSDFEQALAYVKAGDYAKALPVLEAEVDRGNRDARVVLAKLYAGGIGVIKNRKRAAELLSCHQDPMCIPGKDEYYLALDFYDGAGLRRSYEDSLYWLILSSKKGFALADKKLIDIGK